MLGEAGGVSSKTRRYYGTDKRSDVRRLEIPNGSVELDDRRRDRSEDQKHEAQAVEKVTVWPMATGSDTPSRLSGAACRREESGLDGERATA